jgi:hypothetical protein
VTSKHGQVRSAGTSTVRAMTVNGPTDVDVDLFQSTCAYCCWTSMQVKSRAQATATLTEHLHAHHRPMLRGRR